MSCKATSYRISIAIFLAMVSFIAHGQTEIDCGKTARFLPKMEAKIAKISTTDPEVITLHSLFVQDMQDELERFRQETFPNLHFCPEIDYYPTVRKCDTLAMRLQQLADTLEVQKRRVDTIFYLMAEEELLHYDTALADYYIDRSLQFNRLQTDALIMKLRFLFAAEKYDECIGVIHLLYNEAPLQRGHENQLSDFTALFYDRLFTMGDSLVKADHAADALPFFETLETFCHDMPSSYCNDDYYHGLIRSKSGIYESYLTIAQVAWQRKNYNLAYKFLDYARSYRLANEEHVEISAKFRAFIDELESRRNEFDLDDDDDIYLEQLDNQQVESEISEEIAPAEPENKVAEPDDAEAEPAEIVVSLPPIVVDTAQQLAYTELLADALYCCWTKNYEQAREKLQAAKAMEECRCVEPDMRVQLLIEELGRNKKTILFRKK